MNERVHTLSGAYALDALPASDVLDFERHLERCPDCTVEVTSMRETAARLAAGTARTPPPELKARVMAGIDRVRQLPPVVPEQNVRRFRIPRPRPAQLFATALLAAAAILAVFLIDARSDLSVERTNDQLMAEVLAAPDARTTTTRVTGAEARVVYSPSRGQLVFVAPELRSLPDAKIYQLWFIGNGSIRSAGLVPGEPGPVLAGSVRAGDALGITVEPSGGSTQPTSDPLAVIPL